MNSIKNGNLWNTFKIDWMCFVHSGFVLVGLDVFFGWDWRCAECKLFFFQSWSNNISFSTELFCHVGVGSLDSIVVFDLFWQTVAFVRMFGCKPTNVESAVPPCLSLMITIIVLSGHGPGPFCCEVWKSKTTPCEFHWAHGQELVSDTVFESLLWMFVCHLFVICLFACFLRMIDVAFSFWAWIFFGMDFVVLIVSCFGHEFPSAWIWLCWLWVVLSMNFLRHELFWACSSLLCCVEWLTLHFHFEHDFSSAWILLCCSLQTL